jgi:hypothetical protein
MNQLSQNARITESIRENHRLVLSRKGKSNKIQKYNLKKEIQKKSTEIPEVRSKKRSRRKAEKKLKQNYHKG